MNETGKVVVPQFVLPAKGAFDTLHQIITTTDDIETAKNSKRRNSLAQAFYGSSPRKSDEKENRERKESKLDMDIAESSIQAMMYPLEIAPSLLSKNLTTLTDSLNKFQVPITNVMLYATAGFVVVAKRINGQPIFINVAHHALAGKLDNPTSVNTSVTTLPYPCPTIIGNIDSCYIPNAEEIGYCNFDNAIGGRSTVRTRNSFTNIRSASKDSVADRKFGERTITIDVVVNVEVMKAIISDSLGDLRDMVRTTVCYCLIVCTSLLNCYH